jgi:hypothetical protein
MAVRRRDPLGPGIEPILIRADTTSFASSCLRVFASALTHGDVGDSVADMRRPVGVARHVLAAKGLSYASRQHLRDCFLFPGTPDQRLQTLDIFVPSAWNLAGTEIKFRVNLTGEIRRCENLDDRYRRWMTYHQRRRDERGLDVIGAVVIRGIMLSHARGEVYAEKLSL